MAWEKQKSDRKYARPNTCRECATDFEDYSRNGRTTCSPECNKIYSVKIRMERGSYEWTDEQKEKLKETQDKMREEGRLTHSNESIAKMSATRREKMKDPEYRARYKNPNHWAKTPEGREYLSKKHKGKEFSKETRAKMSRSAAARVRNKPESSFTRGTGGVREDLGQYFRSTWEANFARILNYQGKEWQYEPATFTLGENISYTPDFLVDGIFYEIKGWWDSRSVKKLLLFREKYPIIRIETIGEEEYKELLEQYKNKLHLE